MGPEVQPSPLHAPTETEEGPCQREAALLPFHSHLSPGLWRKAPTPNQDLVLGPSWTGTLFGLLAQFCSFAGYLGANSGASPIPGHFKVILPYHPQNRIKKHVF